MTDIAKYIDHTLLRADAREEEIRRLCEEAKEYGFYSCCVNPCHLTMIRELLRDSAVKCCVVVGFPLGAMTAEAKAFETRQAIELGADEIDMVLAVGALKDGRDEVVEDEIRAVVDAARGKTVKVILECCLLTSEEIRRACEIAERAGARFVKTSTGFSNGGARVEDVRLMRDAVSPKVKVKASGGIRCLRDAELMIEAGAERLGCSAGVQIVREEKEKKKAHM